MKNLAIIILVSFIALSCTEEETINTPTENKNTIPVEPGNLVTDTYVESVPESRPSIGDNAPNFILNRNTEHEFELKDLRGKVVYLKFWHTRCTSCKVSIPQLMSKSKEIEDEDFVVIMVSVDRSAHNIPAETVKDFIKDEGMDKWLNIYDGKSNTTAIWNQYYTGRATPYALLIDRNGVIVSHVGSRSSQFVTTVKEELER